MDKCIGCGVLLQTKNELEAGYTTDLSNKYCKRCFDIKNYNIYTKANLTQENIINIITEIGKKTNLVLLVIDLLCIPDNIKEIRNLLKNNKVVLVLNKYDLFEHITYEEKLKNYFNNMNLNLQDIVCISTFNNFNFDKLLEIINEKRGNKDVYLIGKTNAGKSSIINNIISLYDIKEEEITISPVPSTTLSKIEVSFNNFKLIDTPGIEEKGNILNNVDLKTIKKLAPKKPIKPITYRIKKDESLTLDDILRIDYESNNQNSMIFYLSNNLKLTKIYSKKNISLKDKDKREFIIKKNNDIVIEGLGFIKVIKDAKITIYIDKNIDIHIRKSLI